MATIAGYTSLGLVVLVVTVCICVAYSWHLLRGGRSVVEAVRSLAGQQTRVHQVNPPHVELEPLTVN